MIRLILAAVVPLSMIGSVLAADLDTVKKDKAVDVAPVKDVSFFLFTDTQISYRYQFPTVSPGVQIQRADGSFVSREAPKQILNISHADAWAYGTNFFSSISSSPGRSFRPEPPIPPAPSRRPTSPVTAIPKPTASIAAPSA